MHHLQYPTPNFACDTFERIQQLSRIDERMMYKFIHRNFMLVHSTIETYKVYDMLNKENISINMMEEIVGKCYNRNKRTVKFFLSNWCDEQKMGIYNFLTANGLTVRDDYYYCNIDDINKMLINRYKT